MAILFYDHLISRVEIDEFLVSCDGPDNHKGKAAQLIDDILFQGIIALILDKLHQKHHHSFLSAVHERPYDPEIINFLRTHLGDDVEGEIRREADKMVRMIIEDLRSDG